MNDWIRLRGAREHNLRGVDLDLPTGHLVVITGVSGSGKSSLALDTLYREGARRFLETFSARARQAMGRLGSPAVDTITGLPPAIAVGQRRGFAGPRSTVGTLSEVMDGVRLLMARAGTLACPGCGAGVDAPFSVRCPSCDIDLPQIRRSTFSFNSPHGACPICDGLGDVDRIDPALLVGDPSKTLREGCLAPTLKRGYIMYSQVTMDALDVVCRAHGFDVDTPWRDLADEQRDVVLHGSDRVRVPLGKHTLESRLKWTGITAKPRQEGTYRGIVTVLAEILRKERNPGVMRFVRSQTCPDCAGTRLGALATRVTLGGLSVAEIAQGTVDETRRFLEGLDGEGPGGQVIAAGAGPPLERLGMLSRLGLGYLRLERAAAELAPGEWQRIRLAGHVTTGLSGLLVVLDEPSVGLHPVDRVRLAEVLFKLRDNGNTVVVVEHDEALIRAADWLVDVGPGAGSEGGRILYSGPPGEWLRADRGATDGTPTRDAFRRGGGVPVPTLRRPGDGTELRLRGVWFRNLQGVDLTLRLGAFNAVSGVSGAGKASLVTGVLVPALEGVPGGGFETLEGADLVHRVVTVSDAPIGRTPRSNPATYTGLFDVIRDLFAALPEARERGWGKGRFSFNTAGGRCETCQGAGVRALGMHFLGAVAVPCPDCRGRRFDRETLSVRLRGRSVQEVLDMTVSEGRDFFTSEPKARRILDAMAEVGLEYLPLGQPSTTLSGGEAQRIKLATELARVSTGRTLYVLSEPTTGLHVADVARLLEALERLVEAGNTVLVIEHDLDVLKRADHLVDLGPGSGVDGGRVVAAGTPEEVAATPGSITGRVLAAVLRGEPQCLPEALGGPPAPIAAEIRLRGVRTNNLQGIDVTIPRRGLTAITGVSGSGKSSLAFGTLFAEGQRRFTSSLSAHAQQFVARTRRPVLDSAEGLPPTVAVGQGALATTPRSTVGTVTGLLALLRLVFARAGTVPCGACGGRGSARDVSCSVCGELLDGPWTSGRLSFNRQEGACPSCDGLGARLAADPARLVTNPDKALTDGAMGDHATGRHYGDPGNQYVHILRAAGRAAGVDFDRPWEELDEAARRLAMEGAGEEEFEAVWRFHRGGKDLEHRWRAPWRGFESYVTEEFERRLETKKGASMRPLLASRPCSVCKGQRLAPAARAVRLRGRSLPELTAETPAGVAGFLDAVAADLSLDASDRAAVGVVSPGIRSRLDAMEDLGLGSLALDRAASTLSGGEARRVRLVSQIGGVLAGVALILDEPTTGLHPRDTARLLGVLATLVEQGNTVVVAEHDGDVIRRADHVVDLGPGPGRDGGRVVAAGTPAEVAATPGSRTGEFLRGDLCLPTPPRRAPGPRVCFTGVRVRNLDIPRLEIPTGVFVALSGVSGSGKSTLLFDVIEPSLRRGRPTGCQNMIGADAWARVVPIDASPIGRTPTSTPATFVGGIFERIRKRFAGTEEAQARGLTAAAFSFNHPGGRCDGCKGAGAIQVSMDVMADVWAPCPECGGSRYGQQALDCLLDGRSIAAVLELTVAEAAEVFADDPRLARPLTTLLDLGLGYLHLGQGADTLSGGEAQRLRLCDELLRGAVRGGGALYLLDEPTAGLHPWDVGRLVDVLDGLVEAGNTVLVIEHEPAVLGYADHLIDLGPEGGDGGGRLVAQGTPDAVMDTPGSHTGRVLSGRAR
ncbi:MAG: excinuclease ABC subunit UvrA [Pseudomonadota bacterium]